MCYSVFYSILCKHNVFYIAILLLLLYSYYCYTITITTTRFLLQKSQKTTQTIHKTYTRTQEQKQQHTQSYTETQKHHNKIHKHSIVLRKCHYCYTPIIAMFCLIVLYCKLHFNDFYMHFHVVYRLFTRVLHVFKVLYMVFT